MKKYLFLTIMFTTFSLTGCATTTNNTTSDAMHTAKDIGMNVLKVAIDNKCRSEIEQQNIWQLAKIAMTKEQAEDIQSKVCGCVSEQAPQHISVIDITNAAIDPQYRAQLAVKVVHKSLQSCYANIMRTVK